MRAAPAILLALLLVGLAPGSASEPTVRLPCQGSFVPSAGPLDTSCVKPIRPGALSSACTLNWVLTDGTDLYIGAANHCTANPELSVQGVDHPVGDLFARNPSNDSAFYRIRAADRHLVTGTMEGWGGPKGFRTPLPGEPILHFGHGVTTEPQEPLQARPGVVLYAYDTYYQVIFASAPGVSGGDSGSPFVTATGEAVGFLSAAVFVNGVVCGATGAVCPPQPLSPVVFAVQSKLEAKHLERAAGKPVWLVTGEPMLST